MHRSTVNLWLLACLLLCLPAAPARAQAAQPLVMPVLTPLSALGFVQLNSLVLDATLTCEGEQCRFQVRQTYYLHSADKLEQTTLRLGLTGPARGASALDLAANQVVLVDARGATLAPIEPDETHAVLWDIALGRDEHRTLTLTFTQTASASPFLYWQAGLDGLAPWHEIGGLRVLLTLPTLIDESAFLSVEPGNYAFDRTHLLWDSEQGMAVDPITVRMFAPPTWQQLSDLRTTGDYAGLARLYTALSEAARSTGVPLPDYADEILAAWQAAAVARPSDATPQLELAGIYQQRAAAQPALRLNYMLLAAQAYTAALQIAPDNVDAANQMRALYYEAATISSRAGDPASALIYLERAAETPGAEADTVAQLEELSLRWAVDLAEQGMVEQALLQLAGRLAPQTEDAILRYAPPFVSARTEVEQSATGRLVRYSIELYGPSAARTMARLEELAAQMQAACACTPSLQRTDDSVLLELNVQAHTPADVTRVATGLTGALGSDVDLIAALLAMPWQAQLEAYDVTPGLWRDVARYSERVDPTSLQVAWEGQAEYVRWRAAELQDVPPEEESAQLEHRLALIALREQQFIWDQLPASVYATYHVSYPGSASDASWLVPWAQARLLQDLAVDYHWQTIAISGVAACVLLLLLLRAVTPKTPRR